MEEFGERNYDPRMAALGMLLRERRIQRKLTFAQAAALGETSVSQMQRIEGGQSAPNALTLLLLMHACGVTLEEALSVIFDPQPTPEKARAIAQSRPVAPAPADAVARVVAEIERDAAHDPELLAALSGFLAGRRSRW